MTLFYAIKRSSTKRLNVRLRKKRALHCSWQFIRKRQGKQTEKMIEIDELTMTIDIVYGLES
jgi:hypothetical protein